MSDKKSNLKKFFLLDYTDRYWKIRENYISTTNKLLRILYYIRLKRIESKTNLELGVSFQDSSAEFASKPYFPHGLNGIIISRKCKIGKNVTVLHQVTIGTKITTIKACSFNDTIAPTIGDNVYIGAGAKIIGNIHVGNNVLIGANAVITKNIPDNHTAVGNPANIFPTKNRYQ